MHEIEGAPREGFELACSREEIDRERHDAPVVERDLLDSADRGKNSVGVSGRSTRRVIAFDNSRLLLS